MYMDDPEEVRNTSDTLSTPAGTGSPEEPEPSINIPKTKTFMKRMSELPEILGVPVSDTPMTQSPVTQETLVGLPLTPDSLKCSSYGSESHYLLQADGFQSREVFCNNLEYTFPYGWEEKTICTLSSESVMEDIGQNDGELLDYLKSIQSGISIIIAMDFQREGDENIWLKRRGYPGINGNVLLLAETLSYEVDNINIPIKDSLEIVENILASRGKTLIDCILHVTRLEEYHKSRIDGVDGFMTMTRSEFLSISEVREHDKEVESPDDGCPVVFKKKCYVCNNPRVTNCPCPCDRVYYCSIHCKDADWESHSKYVHRGIFMN